MDRENDEYGRVERHIESTTDPNKDRWKDERDRQAERQLERTNRDNENVSDRRKYNRERE